MTIFQNYRPASLLPIFSKVFSNVLFITRCSYVFQKTTSSKNHSVFKPGDSCANQLLAITHEFFSSFEDNYEIRGVKAFNNVWHDGFNHRLKRNRISGNLLCLLRDFLRNRKQLFLTVKVSLGHYQWCCPPRFYIRSARPTSLIYPMIFNVIPSYLPVTHPCILLLKCPKEQLLT